MSIAKNLLDIKAVILSPTKPFTWASGIKSPIYCDNRLTLSYPNVRNEIVEGFVDIITTQFPEVEMIMGTATAGIPHAALIADRLDLPMGYVRSSSKSHGRENKIEGRISEGQRVVVIEDLISTGGSSIAAAQALDEAGCEILGVAAIFSYQLKDSEEAFREANLPLKTLTNYDELLEIAVETEYINPEALKGLKKWKLNPHDESWINE